MATTLGTIDIGGNGKEVLLSSLNLKLGTNFSMDDFEFGDPTEVTMPNPTHNTVITFGPKAHSGYYGIKKVYYNRVHVSDLGVISVTKGNATRVSHLLTKINQKYGILITELDIYDALLPDIPAGQDEIEVNLNFRPTSVVFYGGTKIVMGTNDPAIGDGTSVTLPFETTYMLFAESISNETLDAYSVAIDKDRARKRVASTIAGADTTDMGLMYQRIITPDEGKNYFGHIVGVWQDPTGEGMKALNVYGHILKRADTAYSWSKVGDIGSVVMTNANEVNQAQLNKPFRFVMQDATGTVYVLGVNSTSAYITKSADNGDTWEDISFTATNIQNASSWQDDKYSILDKAIIGTNLFLVVHDKTDTVATLKAVKVDLTSGITTEIVINSEFILNTQAKLAVNDNNFIKASLVSTEDATLVQPSIALLCALDDSRVPEVFWCDYDSATTKYVIKATAVTSLYPNQNNYDGSFISAYSLQLEKDATINLDVIEIGTMVNNDTPDFETFARTDRLRTETGFYRHGIVVLSSVRKEEQRNSWRSTSLALEQGSVPQRLIFTELGKRSHYVMQPEYGIFQLSFTEDNDILGFVVVTNNETLISLEAHTGFTYHSSSGVGKYVKPEVIETLNTNYGMSSYSNSESTAAAISYSFLTRTTGGSAAWLNSPDTSTALTVRSFPGEYKFMGGTPIAIFNAGDDLYAVARGNKGIFKRNKATKQWNYYCALRAFYKPANEDTYIGWSNLQLEPEDIKEFILDTDNDVGSFLIKFNKSIKVSKVNSSDFTEDHTLADEAIVFFDVNHTVGYPESIEYKAIDSISAYGFNAMQEGSPRKFNFFSSTSTGDVVYDALGSTSADYDTAITNFTAPAGFPAGLTVLDVRSDVTYLNIKAIYYCKDSSEVYKLVYQQNDDSFTSTDLFGGTNPTFSTFKPEKVFYLYDYVDTNYVPLIYYSNKRLMLMGRVVEDGSFPKTIHNLSIPTDNGAALTVVPVFSSNRREYLFAQKGNGIFKLNYTYDSDNRIATFSLTRLFSLGSGLEAHNVISSCVASKGIVTHPTVALIPAYPANGTLLSTYCSGTTKMGKYANGSGGFYNDTIAVNSADCGYVPPPAGTLAADAVTLTASLTQVDSTMIVPTVETGEEGDYAFATYKLANALSDDVTFDVSITFETAAAEDIDASEVQIGSGAFTAITLPGTVTVPAGETQFVLRFKFVTDSLTEGDETFKVVVAKQAGETHISNNDNIEVEFTIRDTSTGSGAP